MMGKKSFTSLIRGKRFYVAILLFFMIFINYVDRINLSVAAPKMASDMGWDPGLMGIVLSSFLWSYAVFLIPMGWFTDKYGARKVSAVAFTIWSLASMLTGVMSKFSSIIFVRLLLGVGESAAYPTAGKIVQQWFPSKERGVATSIYNSGGYAGPAIATPIVAWLVVKVGWQLSFIILGGAGFLWLILFLIMFQTPEACKWLPKEEKEYILSTRGGEQVNGEIDDQKNPSGLHVLGSLLRQKTMWGLAITQGCAVYSQYLFLTWLPTYLVTQRHMELIKAGFYSAIPYIAAVILGIVFGKISDEKFSSDKLKQGHRRYFVVIFMLLSSIVLLTNMINSQIGVIILISLSLSAIATSISLNFALTNDLVTNSKIIGTVMGVLVFGANIFGMLAPIVTGYIVKATGSFNSAFILAGMLLVLGGLASLTLTKKPITYVEQNEF